MKLSARLFINVLIISSFVLSLTSCDANLGKILDKAEDDLTKEAEYPSVDFESGSAILHYGDSKTLSVTASVDDGGTLSYQWFSGTKNDSSKATIISSADSSSYTITAPNQEVEKTYYWCQVTNKNPKSGKTNSAWSSAYDITVSNIIRYSGAYITENTTWDSTYTYFITSWVEVEKSLVIPKGTVIKFAKDAYLETSGSGTITVNGSITDEETAPVIFTSYLDHSVGITIPEYASSATKAEKGDWKGIEISGAQGSKFDYVIFRYANISALELNKKTTVQNCVFTNNKSNDDFSGALTIREDANESVVKNNIFYNNDWPLYVSANYSVDTSNIFHNPDDESVTNTNQAIVLECGKYIKQGKTVNWMVTELPYFAAHGTWVSVDAGGLLNIGDDDNDVIVKFNNGFYLETNDSNGLIKLGQNSILTSWKDDEHGGDIENNGQPADPEDGDWDGVSIAGADCFGWKNALNMDSERVLYNDKSKYEE